MRRRSSVSRVRENRTHGIERGTGNQTRRVRALRPSLPMHVTPSRTGVIGRAIRALIARNAMVRGVVKSAAGQRVIQVGRVMATLEARSALRLVMESASGRRDGTYTLRRHERLVALRLRTNDLVSVSEVFYRGAYTMPAEIRARLAALQTEIRVVDLGANIGMFTLWIADELPASTITAVEPDVANVSQLTRLIASNELGDRVLVIAKAAAAHEGVILFAGGDFMHSRVIDNGEGYPVETIDAFTVLREADLVKMDIEGAEWPIIHDARFAACAAVALTMEWHATSQHPHGRAELDARSALDAAGYRLVSSYSEESSCGTLWAVRDLCRSDW